jgi:aromatic-L-amino-acid decarboxylase
MSPRAPRPLRDLAPRLLTEPRAARRFGRAVADASLEYLAGVARGKTYSGASIATLDRLFNEPLPEHGAAPSAVLREARRKVFRHSMQMAHPRLFGLFCAAPLPVAALAELPAAILNQSLDAWKAGPAATHLEVRLIRWMNDLIGYPRSAFGLLTSGGGIANTIALKLARDGVLGARGRRSGIPARAAGRLRVYASDQAHFSIARSLDVLGMGERALVRIPSDRRMKMIPEALTAAIARDRRRGLRPVAVVATAGTTNTGNIDPLAAITAIARAQDLHLHVDAAYGGALLFSERFGDRLRGLERADSITIDPHKWLFQPFSLGGLFVRDGASLHSSFHTEPDYLRKDLEREPERLDFYHYSMEGSHRFRGLKLWFTLKTLGRSGLARLVDRTMDVALHLERRVRADPRFEIFDAPVELASVCFRYLPEEEQRGGVRRRGARRDGGARRRARLNGAQTAIQQEIERSGAAWFPNIVLRGDVYFRFGVFNYLTTEEDVDAVLRLILRVAKRLRV